ncbi:PIN domain-containing protein [Ruegeria arenilitoris]|uniref:PIN domain-containing protein n=1 Tax=Ruegeria arenilitoris TaxID=1173585 RepID=UPI00147FF735|nr:PIN domain-containing protein [Ruegeria arenilitoris]
MNRRVFLDTNILLSFYEISKENIDKLREAFALVDHKELLFITTDQVEEEFYRRRNSVIEKSLKSLSELRMPEAPTVAKALASNSSYEEARKTLKIAHDKLLNEIREQAFQKSLSADDLLSDYFKDATRIEVTPELVQAARLRVDLGNPPGKKGSLGDAVNWEAILSLPHNHPVVIVSDDVDYRDRLKPGSLNEYLQREWAKQHEATIELFRSFSDYLEKDFSDLKISIFEVVDKKINELEASPNFFTTHAVIADLSTVTQFTAKQVDKLVEVLSENTQVSWIFGDSDVEEFYTKLLNDFGDKMGAFERKYLAAMLEYDGEGDPPEMLPF